jgi:hypothetical protein
MAITPLQGSSTYLLLTRGFASLRPWLLYYAPLALRSQSYPYLGATGCLQALSLRLTNLLSGE